MLKEFLKRTHLPKPSNSAMSIRGKLTWEKRSNTVSQSLGSFLLLQPGHTPQMLVAWTAEFIRLGLAYSKTHLPSCSKHSICKLPQMTLQKLTCFLSYILTPEDIENIFMAYVHDIFLWCVLGFFSVL
jgi:hypothetical protein